MTQPDTSIRSRYYYADPLAAAWMAKHHEMKFEHLWMFDRSPFGCELAFSGNVNIQAGSDNSHVKFYIHPDSLHLLEPRKGDLVDLGRHGFAFVTDRDDNNINCALFNPDIGVFKDGYWHRRWHPIIQRDGAVFMWPEREAI